MATVVPGAAPKRRAAERVEVRPPPTFRAAVRRAPHNLCVALLQPAERRTVQVEKWIEENYSDRLTTRESVVNAARWIFSIKEDILVEALEDRVHLRNRVTDYNSRVRAAIEKLEIDYLRFASPIGIESRRPTDNQ